MSKYTFKYTFFIVVSCLLIYFAYTIYSKRYQESADSLCNFMLAQCNEHEQKKFMESIASKNINQQDELSRLHAYERTFVEIKFGRLGKFNNFMYKVNRYVVGIKKVAYHEAAHTLVGLLKDCGLQIKWTSLELCKGMFGYTYFSENIFKTKVQQMHVVMMLLAGGIGEQLHEGKQIKCVHDGVKDLLKRQTVENDIAVAKSIIQKIQQRYYPQENEYELLCRYYKLTYDFLDQYYTQVILLADLLLEQKFVPCYQSYALVVGD